MSPRNLVGVYVGGRLVNESGISTNPLAPEASVKIHEIPAAVVPLRGHPH